MKDEFVDSQVNYGKSVFGPNCDIDFYDREMSEKGLTQALVIPTSTHELELPSYWERSCIWGKNPDGKIVYWKELHQFGLKYNEINPPDPYSRMNKQTLAKIRSLNKSSSVKYWFVPKVHPVLDNKDNLEQWLAEPETKAVKINGLAAHVIPEQVPRWIVELVNDYNKPLIIHTDYLNQDFFNEEVPEHLYQIIAGNNPKDWLDWGVKQNVGKLCLTHLVRMDEEVIKEINERENVCVGLGPDLMLQEEWMRLKTPTDNILRDALAKSDKLVFSTDFAWNVKKRNNWEELDWETKQRLEEEAERLGLSKQELQKILSKKAIEFFELG